MKQVTTVNSEIQNRDDYKSLIRNIETAISESKSVMVFDEPQVDKAGFYIKNFRKLEKSIETLRKSIVDPLNLEVKTINNFFKGIKTKIEPEQARLEEEVNTFLREKREREEEQRKKEQDELEESLLSEAEIFEDESVLDTIPEISFKQTGIGDISANITTARVKKWRLIDIDKVPRKYLILDESLIGRIRKEHEFEDESPIEGIEFYFEETIRTK